MTQPPSDQAQADKDIETLLAEHFDAAFYYKAYPDVAAAGMDPFLHYTAFGWREMRNPNPHFSTSDYLKAHPSLVDGDQSPLHHFVFTNFGDQKDENPTPAPAVIRNDFEAITYSSHAHGSKRLGLKAVAPNGIAIPSDFNGIFTQDAVQNVDDALERIALHRGLTAETLTYNSQSQIDLVTATAQSMFENGKHLETAILTLNFLTNVAALRFHLASSTALMMVGYIKKVIQEQENAAVPGSPIASALFETRLDLYVVYPEDRSKFIDGRLNNLGELVDKIKTSGHDMEWVSRVFRKLVEIRSDLEDTPENFDMMCRGCVISRYFYYNAAIAQMLIDKIENETLTPVEMGMLNEIGKTIQDVESNSDCGPLIQAWKDGHSVVLTLPHAGIHSACHFALKTLDLSVIIISADPVTDFSNPKEIRISVHGKFHLNFVRAVKLMKKSQYALIIYPDAEHGEQRSVSLLGNEISLGKGAGTIAYLSKAHTFFMRTRWVDNRLIVSSTPGPKPTDFSGEPEFTKALDDFYVDELRDIALGPVIDMSPNGGFWESLSREPE